MSVATPVLQALESLEKATWGGLQPNELEQLLCEHQRAMGAFESTRNAWSAEELAEGVRKLQRIHEHVNERMACVRVQQRRARGARLRLAEKRRESAEEAAGARVSCKA